MKFLNALAVRLLSPSGYFLHKYVSGLEPSEGAV